VNNSISRQLIFWLAIPLLVMALCAALVHYFNNVAPGVLDSDRRLRDASNSVMAHVLVTNNRITLDASPEAARALPAPDIIKFALRDSAGRLLAGYPEIPAVTLASDASQLVSLTSIDHRNLRTLTARFDTRGGVVFVTAVDLRSPTDSAARYSFIGSLLWDFVQLNITLVLVWIGVQLGLRPVKRLRNEIADRSPYDLRPIVESSVPREIAPVVVTLNRLFATLRTSVQSQQQFIANTAHQLRTPITGMQAQLDLLAAEPAAKPVLDRLTTLQEGIRQLAHAANQLLTLARADPTANLATKNQPIDVKALIGEVVAKFFDRALQLNIDLGVELQPATLIADPSLLDDLLNNLVDNALKYTPPGGRVTVSVVSAQGKTSLSVEDSGPGIPESERQRVRQRFYRLPNSPGHGSGLGLAIVDEIAHLYGATLVIAPATACKGTKITVQFP
jgi:two-component system sensor histidine kinase TctE